MTPPVMWMVQTNLGNAETHDAIKAACDRHGLMFQGVQVIPFSPDLPDIEYKGPVLAYGSTKFIKKVVDSKRWQPGAFFDEEVFTVRNCLKHWRERMVNDDSAVLRLDEVHELGLADHDDVFVRPNSDLKEFAGEVMQFRQLKQWVSGICAGFFEFDGSLRIAVATPKPIASEWRVFAVNGNPIASTRYRLHGRKAVSPMAPYQVLQFVRNRLKEWLPAPAVAVDVAEVRGEYRVLELSDIHSAGHYAADVDTIVRETSAAAAALWKPR